ncbi:4-hydroxybenzoate 3-monooxygenase [Crossiella sp. CA-258035]|uniref:4-hydroxybenzoate 3-monooxygenase n=1 Tax=Crossiella sp. CA-258035 TaxID=2981138 RepID=UPI0024BCB947|nr:4-hydroxybenzoate 3-monooxygenase [Crossiella sp. CA-258035]WHT22351.1 4-hydroxybenzoate 3-monooxygenase [Crossiella sp. CA-258035]
MRTRVGIVGAGPAGLLLSHLLHRNGIDSVVLETRSRDYVEKRVRAGVLEAPTVELLREAGLAERLDRECLTHHGILLRFDGVEHRIDFADLVGKAVTVYGQQELVKDLIAARLRDGGDLRFEVSEVSVHELRTDSPWIHYTDRHGRPQVLDCEVIAGCDGFHGVTRPAAPTLTALEHRYPFAWLGILARTPPTRAEVVYAAHDRGFALASMRSPEISRLYLQVSTEDTAADWPLERVWSELSARLGEEIRPGEVLETIHTDLRAFVAEPMRHGRLFLAGDAAHIVPPTGAKGLNLAIADVALLADALTALLVDDDERPAESYSDTALRRVWRAQRFSSLMTDMLHRPPDGDRFQRYLQLSQLHHTVSSTAAATSLAEDYVGPPFARTVAVPS